MYSKGLRIRDIQGKHVVSRRLEYLDRERWHLFAVCCKMKPVIQTTNAQIQKPMSHLKILYTRTVICSSIHTNNPQIFWSSRKII
jgi:hypothetical protein